MTQKHTPGPWKVDTARNPVQIRGAKAKGTDGLTIAMMYDNNGMRIDEPQANARLIAAAPELLDILNEIMSCGFIFDDLGKYPKEAALAIKARAAIAKAEGK